MSFYSISKKELTDIADAIRAKTGKTNGLTVDEMPTEIGGISGDAQRVPFTEVSTSRYFYNGPNLISKCINLNVSVKTSVPSGVMYYYNHEELPEIPADVVENYPYIMIMRTPTIVRIYASMSKAYFWTTDEGKNRITIPSDNCARYTLNQNVNAWILDYNGTNVYFNVHGDGNWTVWWSNYDIPNGSEDATEIYFHASASQEERPADATHYYYDSVRLPAIPADLLAQYPCAWIRKDTINGYYDLVLCEVYFYYDPNNACMYDSNWKPKYHYRTEIAGVENATEWVFVQEVSGGFVIDEDRLFVWSNHDVPNGSVDATNIYRYGTLAVPEPIK